MEGHMQNVVVMRHGDRADNRRTAWAKLAQRPWDPPLLGAGKVRAWTTGKSLREVGFPIHRVVVSPFLRCLQTAAEVVSALCALDASAETSDGVVIDPSKIKVSIEYGLCEVIGSSGIDPTLAPRDGEWFPGISELESIFPAGTVDHSAESIYKYIPSWEEPQKDAWKRFADVVKALADKYPHENLLLITHGQCVAVSVFAFLEGSEISSVRYCAFAHFQRQKKSSTSSYESFKLYNQSGIGITTKH